jgi:ABC-type transport system involved in cytochrome bd biosynthesis fused ATPase/permease subunit
MRTRLAGAGAEFGAAILVNGGGALLLVAAFRILGSALYRGHDPAWIVIAVPVALSYAAGGLASWLASDAGMRVSARLREVTLDRVLAVDPDAARTIGAGQAQSIALDAELVGSLLVTTGPGAVLGLAQAGIGVAVLVRGRHAVAAVLIVVAFVLAVVAAAIGLGVARRVWSERRTSITSAMIERMLGSRTVSIQEQADTAAQTGARLLHEYRHRSRAMDRWSLGITGASIFGGAALLIGATAGLGSGPTLATNVGGAVLAGPGFAKLGAGLIDTISARDALARLLMLGRLQKSPVSPPRPVATGRILEAADLTFRYPSGEGLQTAARLVVDEGDRILIAGSSGAGKSTLGELLSGRRAPTTGVIAARPGARIVRAPQTGDDYVFHASLLFNVMCGSQWPPSDAGAQRAMTLLRELGLGELVDRMPSGIAQPVGEGGWRLSTGEAARVGLARALHTEPDVLILDETTAPLDPVSRRQTLTVAERHCRSLIVIAHK